MSQMLAPYNNSMRLGQGFNSYTQQICLDRAVLSLEFARSLRNRKNPDGNNQPSGVSSGDGGSDLRASDYDEQPQGKELTDEDVPKVMPWVKPQIVTYSSRFVEKISDVTDAMNISGSLSIKTATIGGKANGSYVDSDKFKSSDINFHLQVKVTNQIHKAPEYCMFNKITKVKKEEFPEVYGDCFISGWEEGGELNAIISIKVHDKSKIFQIKAGLEGELSTPGIGGGIKGDFNLEKMNLNSSTETTISVSWSGGGSIKNATDDWTIKTLKQAAAAFPDLVAVTPQRTYAILTKYTALADFHLQKDDYSLIDYENAGIYTNSLLDHYMDYKAMWKQISYATYELKGGRATIEMARPSQEINDLATIRKLPTEQVDAKGNRKKLLSDKENLEEALKDRADMQDIVSKPGNPLSLDKGVDPHDKIEFKVFSPTFAGLVHARKVCRFEMAKIVNEVDLVTSKPEVALVPDRDTYFLNPLVFEQLIPIVRSLSPESARLGVKDPDAALLLGYIPPVEKSDALEPVYKLNDTLDKYHEKFQNSIQLCSWKAQDYLLEGIAGSYKQADVHTVAQFANDLETLDATFRPTKLMVWSTGQIIEGIGFEYSKDSPKKHGAVKGTPSHIWELATDASETIVEVLIRQGVDSKSRTVISSVVFVTSKCRVFDTAVEQDEKDKPAPATSETEDPTNKADLTNKPVNTTATPAEDKAGPPPKLTRVSTLLRPEGAQWSLRGFCSFFHSGAIISLGVVWSKDMFVPVPTKPISLPICKSFLPMGKGLRENVRQFKNIDAFTHYADKFLLGTSVAAAVDPLAPVNDETDTVKPFNAMNDIGFDWTIKTIAFSSAEGKLTGLKVTYMNGKWLEHGNCDKPVWSCEVDSELVVVKLTAGRVAKEGPGYVDTVEFIRADKSSKKGEQALWPLDVSTLRYLGEGATRVSVDQSSVVEKAPNFGDKARWTVRGFYGECKEGVISRLGVVWGRG